MSHNDLACIWLLHQNEVIYDLDETYLMIYVGTYRKSSKDTRNSFIFLQVLLAFGIWIFNKGKRIYNTYLLS